MTNCETDSIVIDAGSYSDGFPLTLSTLPLDMLMPGIAAMLRH